MRNVGRNNGVRKGKDVGGGVFSFSDLFSVNNKD